MIVEHYNTRIHKDNIHTLVNRVNTEELAPDVRARLIAHIEKECIILIERFNVDYTDLAFECIKC